MNKYSDKSDFEINKAVAECVGYKVKPCDESVLAYIDSGFKAFDPYNSPADAMPIFIENKMGAMFLGDLVQIINFSGTIANFGNNFYRTIAELFLMMKEAENETNT